MIIAPCKDCKDRTIICHSVCEKYLEYCKEMERIRNIRNKENEIIAYSNNRRTKVIRYYRRAGVDIGGKK